MQAQILSKGGSLGGGILLVSGCCIGAGMLGLPILSALAGFTPSVILFCLSWLFMVCTGLLLLEVNLWFKEDVSIITMAGQTLGKIGKAIGWAGFLFLFYALMVAYISGTGVLIGDFVEHFIGKAFPAWIGSFALCLLLGVMVYLGTKAVDWFNRFFMAGLIAAYAFLVALGAPHVDPKHLMHADWTAAYLVVPAMIISFGYHNLIPTLTTYLRGDVRRLKITLIVGSMIPLFVYLVWEWLLLGLVPIGNFKEAFGQGEMTTRVLKNAVGSSIVVDLANSFAFFAIVTSFLGVSLSFVDFLADGLHIKKNGKGKTILCLLVIVFPFACSLLYPKIFLTALRYAGSFGAVTLFGILPAAMVWSGRYYKNKEGPRLLPGGRIALAAIVSIAIAVILLQVVQDLRGVYG